ncbi:MAG: pilin [Patescibacteria group bacterium]
MKTTLKKDVSRTNISRPTVLFLPFIATALASFFGEARTASAVCDPSSWKFCNPLEGTIESLTEAGTKSIQALLGLIGTIALLFLIVAGITYITAAGEEEKIKNAKKMITGTIIGLGITLIAYSLLVTVSEILGVK